MNLTAVSFGTLAILSLALIGCESRGGDATGAPGGARQAATTAATADRHSSTSAATTGGEDAAEEVALADITQLSSGFTRAGEAYFSADMSWIIFQATPTGEQHYQMYVAPLTKNGADVVGLGTPVRISPANSRNTCGFFSPDGRSLVFASTAGKEKPDAPAAGYQRQGGNYRWDFPEGMEIFRVDEWQERLRDAAAPPRRDTDARGVEAPGDVSSAVDLATKAITDNSAYDAEAAYSPDGKWLVFGSRRDGDSELYVMRPDGTGVVRLTTAKGYDGGPFFSPDGRRLVYRSDRKGNDLLQVFVADLAFDAAGNITALANERQLTDDANVNWGPYFHPDGRHVIYATSAHGHHNYELYVMRDDGSRKTRITHEAGFDGLPVFSPDGRYLMWSSKRTADNTTQIFLAKFRPPAEW